jgi:CheY-like chemotaxis protein
MELIGCQVRASYDAASAMLVAAEFNPQVCLLDLKMPGMNGFELAGAQVGSAARFLIATTALGDEESRKQSQAAAFTFTW